MVAIDIDLRQTLGPVRDQGPRPTCLSHALTLAHEHSRQDATPLSPEYLHFFATNNVPRRGSTFPAARTALKNVGQPKEEHCPYFPGDPPAAWIPPSGLSVYRRSSSMRSSTASSIEHLLREGVLPVLGLTLSATFFTPSHPWVISADGGPRGRHAVLCAGAGDYLGGRVVLVRNSWGAGWGDGGHAWLDESFLAEHLREVLTLDGEVAA